jgi:hypothetical protein
MAEVFVLYAFNRDREFSFPLARVLVASADYKFFQENKVEGMTQGEWFTEWVLKCVRKECPCLLPFDGDGWEFYLNTEGVAVMHQGERIFYLPLIDLTTAPSGVII